MDFLATCKRSVSYLLLIPCLCAPSVMANDEMISPAAVTGSLNSNVPTAGPARHKNIIIIKDIRFENEAEYIRKIGGAIWHIVRENAEPVNQHSSELGIAAQDSDTIIQNNGTLEEYRDKLDSAWAALSERISNEV